MKKGKKYLALGLAVTTAAVTVLSGCGGKKSGDSDPDHFTYLIDQGENTKFYKEYEDNPAYKYWASKEWDVDGEKKKISIDFSAPTSGSESDYLNTLLSTGEYPDIMGISRSSATATKLYNDGVAIDITEYVDKYMPNYKAWVKKHNYENYVTNVVDGKRRYIQLYNTQDDSAEMWGGYEYRRDWIVKYGKNPQTGAAFSGQLDDQGNWTDDVVFPSGETYPKTISDWEWMLGIFQTAIQDQNLEGGYPTSISYQGLMMTSDFISGFGGAASWYIADDGKVHFGLNEDHTKAYIECMSTWYKNGWIDKKFQEHAQDIFFSIDQKNIYAGKVGAWYGLESQLGTAMDTSNGDTSNPVNGIVVFGAPQPINDKYGTPDDQNKAPTAYFTSGLCSAPVIFTSKLVDDKKDIPALFTALDWLFDPDNAILCVGGLSKEQQAKVKDPFYEKWGLTDGGWWPETTADGQQMKRINTEVLQKEDGLASAAALVRVVHHTPTDGVDRGRLPMNETSVEYWTMYPQTGNIPDALSKQLTSEQADQQSVVSTNMMTYISTEFPGFITGEKTIDKDWDAFAKGLDEQGVQDNCKYLNDIIGK